MQISASYIALSSEEVRVRKESDQNALLGFRPKTDGDDFGKQGYRRKELLKRSRMVQNSAS